MANNRLFIYNKESNIAMLLAKAFGEWECRVNEDAINDFLNQDDWTAACDGGPSNFSLITEDQLPYDVSYFTYYAEAKQKARESMQRINDLFKPKPHVSFKRKLEAKKQKVH